MQEIFNHVLEDVELFMDKVSMISSAQEKSQKKKGLMRKLKKKGLFPPRASDINECRDEGSEVCFVPQLLQR